MWMRKVFSNPKVQGNEQKAEMAAAAARDMAAMVAIMSMRAVWLMALLRSQLILEAGEEIVLLLLVEIAEEL